MSTDEKWYTIRTHSNELENITKVCVQCQLERLELGL